MSYLLTNIIITKHKQYLRCVGAGKQTVWRERAPAVERARHLQRTGGIASTQHRSSATMCFPRERSVAVEVAELDFDGHVGRGNTDRRTASTRYRDFTENEAESVWETADTEKRCKKKRFMFFLFLGTILPCDCM